MNSINDHDFPLALQGEVSFGTMGADLGRRVRGVKQLVAGYLRMYSSDLDDEQRCSEVQRVKLKPGTICPDPTSTPGGSG